MPPHGGSALGTPADGVIDLPQLSATIGGVGAVANTGHATVDEPPAGSETVGALIVYVYTQGNVVPLHAVYVNVHVFVPLHGGSALGTPADTVSVRPQLSITVGAVGAVANAGQATVDDPPEGIVTVGGLMVYVYTHGYVDPSHAVYVNVHVFVPLHGGSAVGTPAEIVKALPQLSLTAGGAGAVANAGHATVDVPPAGIVTVGALMVYV